MRIPKSEFTDADMKLCRAHGDAVANEPDYVLWARVTDTKAALAELDRKVAYHVACDAFEACVHLPSDPPLPPSYWSDLEHWLKTLAPAKPAEVKPAPSDAWAPAIGDRIMINEGVDRAGFYFPGDTGIIIGIDHDFDLKVKFDASSKAKVSNFWYVNPKNARLASTSSADGAALVVEKMKHSVCIKAHGFAEWVVGEVMPGGTAKWAHPENWRACTPEGWVPHTPTADSMCPVPDGVAYEALRRSGTITLFGGVPDNAWQIGFKYDRSPVPGDVVAWRPISDGSK